MVQYMLSLRAKEVDIEEVLRRLKEEHPFALVNKVVIRWSEPTDQFDSFSIRR